MRLAPALLVATFVAIAACSSGDDPDPENVDPAGGKKDGGPGADGNQDGVPDASEIPFVNACLCTTGPHRGLTPMGVVLVLGLPLLGFGRRRFRR